MSLHHRRPASPRWLAFTLGTLLTLTISATALAGPQEALSFYEQAQKAYEQGNFQKAADLLERAFAEDPNLIYQYNRILALQAAGQHEEALRLLNIYENPMRTDEDKRFEDIAEIKAKIEKSIADKKTAPTDPVKNNTDPDQNGDGTKNGEGNTTPTPTPTPTPKAEDKGPKILAWSLVGVGGALIVGGMIPASGLLVTEEEKLANGEPNPKYNDQLSSQKRLAAGLLGGGAVLAIGGAVLLLLDDDEPAKKDASALRFSPYVGPGGAGAVMQWRF